jgi:two-component system, NtrC family, response regulator PilR
MSTKLHPDHSSSPSTSIPKILVVDDELSMREVLEIFLLQQGYLVELASNPLQAKAILSKENFDLVLSDLRMPHGGGLKVLDYVQRYQTQTPTIVMTAFASTETAIQAMKNGAHDYLTKPFKLDNLEIIIQKSLQHRALILENKQLKENLASHNRFEGLIGQSDAMQKIFELIRRVAAAKTPILILGESGTGKEMVAQAIHAQSSRSKAPFVAINCAALPEHLMESELFGHEKGAFTGALAHKQGLFQAASGGTLFLDEIGEMPLLMQAKLLRALQEQKVKAVGSWQEVPVDLRIIAATNRSLLAAVQKSLFREDLYYRLNVIPIHLPALRERPSDIPLLAQAFIQKYNSDFNKKVEGVDDHVMQALIHNPFPGNVRELKNLIERAMALAKDIVLTAHDFLWETSLPQSLNVKDHIHTEQYTDSIINTHHESNHEYAYASISMESEIINSQSSSASLSVSALLIQQIDQDENDHWDLNQRLADIEKELMIEALDRTDGNKTEAAKLLGISFRSMRYRLQKLKID